MITTRAPDGANNILLGATIRQIEKSERTLWRNPYRKYATNQSNRQDGFQNLERRRPIIEHDTEPVLHQQTNSPELQAIFTIFLILIWYIHWAGTPCGNILISQVTNYWSNVLARCRLHQAKNSSWTVEVQNHRWVVNWLNTITITRSGTLGRLQSEIYIVNVSFESGKLKVITVGNRCQSCFP